MKKRRFDEISYGFRNSSNNTVSYRIVTESNLKPGQIVCWERRRKPYEKIVYYSIGVVFNGKARVTVGSKGGNVP